MIFDGLTLTHFLALLIGLAGVAAIIALWLRPQQAARSSADSAPVFEFESPEQLRQKQFLFEVAGLVQITTGFSTKIVSGARDGVDIEVYKGMRCVGAVGVVSGDHASPLAQIRALASFKQEKRIKSAYLVSKGEFNDKARNAARKFGIALVDGGMLNRMRAGARAGRYIRQPKTLPPPPGETAENARWRRPPKPAPGTKRSVKVTGSRNPWLDYY